MAGDADSMSGLGECEANGYYQSVLPSGGFRCSARSAAATPPDFTEELAMLRSILLLAVLIPGTPAPQPKPYYHPTCPGDTLVYHELGKEYKWVVKRTEETVGAVVVSVHATDARGELHPLYGVSVTEKGVFKLWTDGRYFTQPPCILKLPYRPGDKWEIHDDGNGGRFPRVDCILTTVREEEVVVGAGKFKAIRLDDEEMATGNKRSWWMAPRVGIVKVTSDSGQSMELKSFTPGR
jgi:hypothetical protein